MAKHSNSMSKAIHVRECALHIKCSLKLYNLAMLILGTIVLPAACGEQARGLMSESSSCNKNATTCYNCCPILVTVCELRPENKAQELGAVAGFLCGRAGFLCGKYASLRSNVTNQP